ncbi:MAG: hypothetical protein MUO99_02765 [Dehalococcoidales bacterium]|jgi:hypothetical protein|nr:hypothetical protein [Dehalococcoidales bacterium]
MRRGCISLGEVQCDECHRVIPNYDRYLVVEEKDGAEDAQGKPANYCIDCATKKGYAHTKDEKGERILTFFP